MRLIFSIAAMIALLLLSGCGPVYQTTYSYVPPKGKMAQMCTMQCQQSKMMCEQLCQTRKENCRLNARQEALYRYERYKSERISQGQPVNRTVDDFYYGYNCSDMGCHCKDDFNTCYTTCGGQVIPHTVCTAFCDKAGVPPAAPATPFVQPVFK